MAETQTSLSLSLVVGEYRQVQLVDICDSELKPKPQSLSPVVHYKLIRHSVANCYPPLTLGSSGEIRTN